MILSLFKKEVVDPFVQENFKRIYDFIVGQAVLRCGFRFLEIDVKSAGEIKHPHRLDFVPKDVIIVHNEKNASITINYSSFDRDYLYFNVSVPTKIRLLVGRFE